MANSNKIWFVVEGEARSGPYSSSQLKKLVIERKLSHSSKVWKEGLAKPVPASRIKGLITDQQKNSKDTEESLAPVFSGDEEIGQSVAPTLNRSETRQLVGAMGNEVALAALKSDRAVSNDHLQDLRKRYQVISSEIDELAAIVPAMEETESKLATAEQNMQSANKDLDATKKRLIACALELGRQGFQNLADLDLDAHEFFEARNALESKIEMLTKESTEVSLSSGSSIVEKAKRKAMQLKLQGQIQVEKLKVKSSDRATGLKLLQSKSEELVRCDATNDLVDRVKSIRREIHCVKNSIAELELPLRQSLEVASRTAGQPVDNLRSFQGVIKIHRSNITLKQDELKSIRCDVATLVSRCPELANELGLMKQSQELAALSATLSDVTPGLNRQAAWAWGKFGRLSRLQKAVWGIGIVFVISFLAWLVAPLVISPKQSTEADDGDGWRAYIERSTADEDVSESFGHDDNLSAANRLSMSQIRSRLSGTYASEDGAFSYDFRYPNYGLNPSTRFVWAKGTMGRWEIYDEHPQLTKNDVDRGLKLLAMTPPDEPNTWINYHVELFSNSEGEIKRVILHSILGIRAAPNQRVKLDFLEEK